MLTVKRRGWAAGILFNLKTQYTNEEQIFYKSQEFKRFFKLLKNLTPLNSLKGTPKNCFFGVRFQFLNPHLQLVNSGLKILSALKNQVFRSSLKTLPPTLPYRLERRRFYFCLRGSIPKCRFVKKLF
jgi:hypothetical protein